MVQLNYLNFIEKMNIYLILIYISNHGSTIYFISYGENIASERINQLLEYTAVVANPPWNEFSKSLTKQPINTILAQNVDENYLENLAKTNQGHGIVVGLGGGVAIDTCKFLSWKWNLPNMRNPSIISVDAFLTKEVGVRNQNRVRYVGKSEPKI
jgi:glycerol dehydrogenase-like iron-containing ADH family enzyme